MMVAAVSAKAQFEAGTFSLQPKVGVGMSWLSNMPALPLDEVGLHGVTLDKSPVASASFGVEAEYQLAPQFSMAAGVNYALMGSGWKDATVKDGSDSYDITDAQIELGYVRVPVTASYYIFKNFAVKAGVQFGFLTNAKAKVKAKSGKREVSQDEDIKDSFEKFDLSIPMGISYQFNVPIVLDLRYNLGLTKVNKESIDGHNDLKNNVVELTVGYKFAL